MSRRTAGPRSRPAAGSPGRGGLASPVAQASGRSAGRPGAAAVLTIPPRIRTAAGPGSGERSGRGWPLPAGHSPNKGALRPLRAPVPAPPRTGRPDPPDVNPIRDNPSSHPAGTYNPLRPRPAPFCCFENNNSAGSAVRLSPLSWEKNLFLSRRRGACSAQRLEVVEEQAVRITVEAQDDQVLRRAGRFG